MIKTVVPQCCILLSSIKGISQWPIEKYKPYDIGSVHIDIKEIRMGRKKWYVFVEIDRMCKYVYGELHDRMTKALAKECLEHPPIVPFVFTRSCRTMGANSPMRCSRSIYDRRAPPTFSIRHGHNTGSNTGLQNSDTPGPWTGGSVQPHDKYPFRQAVPRRYRGPTQAPPHSVPSVYNFQRPLTSLEIPIPACHDSGHLSTSSRIVLVGSMQENCGLN